MRNLTVPPKSLPEQVEGVRAAAEFVRDYLEAREPGAHQLDLAERDYLEQLAELLLCLRAAHATLASLQRRGGGGAAPVSPQGRAPGPDQKPRPRGRDFSSGRSAGRDDRPAESRGLPKGARQGKCRSCGAAIWWSKEGGGRWHPLNPDGRSHFATCPEAGEWRRTR